MRVGIVGTGLIGASIGLAARRWLDAEVVGWDADPSTLGEAADRGAVAPAEGVEQVAEGSDLVFICTPIPAVAPTAAEVLAAGPRVVSDTASVKAAIVRAVSEAAPDDLSRFVGGHPLTGSERSGPGAAAATLIDGAAWALTPTDATDPAATDLLEESLRRMGANPVRLTPERHDRLVAAVSHLPQIASTAMMRTTASEGEEDALLLAAGGFRDLTRLAASSPELWADILLANRAAVAGAVEGYVGGLRRLVELLEAQDADGIREAFREAKEARLTLAARPQSRVGVAILGVTIPDRPGALADITGLLAERSVNIEDIEIVHAAEGARGTAHLTVGEGDAEAAVRALADRDYDVARLA